MNRVNHNNAAPLIPEKTNLNTADAEALGRLPGIGPDKAWDIMQHRPYTNWDDVKRVPGIPDEAVEVMQKSGAVIEP